jgi:hypothetical protein
MTNAARSRLASWKNFRSLLVYQTKVMSTWSRVSVRSTTATTAPNARLLATLDARAVDYLVSQDANLHKRASRVGLGERVLTIDDALQWLKLTFVAKSVELPNVIERKAYELNEPDPIFASLREDLASIGRGSSLSASQIS